MNRNKLTKCLIRPCAYWLCFMGLGMMACTQSNVITTESLLLEMVDRDAMASYPSADFSLAQFSSYDRATTAPGDSTWFANWDRSMFIREIEQNGRKEYVLFDTVGPGAVVRFWMTFAGDNAGKGILRFYIDGAEEPVIEGAALDILSGTELIDGILATSVSDSTEYKMRGHNLYLPIPYGQRCVITYESDGIKDPGAKTGGEAVYYNINYRTYHNDASVRSFSLADLENHRNVLDSVQELLSHRVRPAEKALTHTALDDVIAAGDSVGVTLEGGAAAIKRLKIKLKSDSLPQALRSTIIQIHFDGNRMVWCPIGDFFGTGYQHRASNTWYTEVEENGNMTAWWVMPFKSDARISFHNLSDELVEIECEVGVGHWKWDNNSMYFGASWHQFTNLYTGERKNNAGGGGAFDINYVELTGKGTYVGDAITLFNTVDAWWGEGDEKIYVDGEHFPSHIGTGTEDYYGYAWCRPEPFSNHPFIAQPDGSGNFHPGYTVNIRFRGLDHIPFRQSLKVDMEMWHWVRAHIHFAPITYYYLLPGGSNNIKPDVEGAREKVALTMADMPDNNPKDIN